MNNISLIFILLFALDASQALSGHAYAPQKNAGVALIDCLKGVPQELPHGFNNYILQNVNGKIAGEDWVTFQLRTSIDWFKFYTNKLAVFDIDQTLFTGKPGRPVYADMVKIFKKLEEEGWKIIALTVRPFSDEIAAMTFDDLEAVGLGPWFKRPANNNPEYVSPDNIVVLSNVIFTSTVGRDPMIRDKGKALEFFLNQKGLRPQVVLFADDHCDATVELSNSCNNLGIQSLSINNTDEERAIMDRHASKAHVRPFLSLDFGQKCLLKECNSGTSIFFALQSFLSCVEKYVDTGWMWSKFCFVDLDDIIFTSKSQLVYREMPRILQTLKDRGFRLIIVTDRSPELFQQSIDELGEQGLAQFFDVENLNFKKFRNGYISKSFIFSSSKVTKDQFPAELCDSYQMIRTPQGQERFQIAHCATKSEALKAYTTEFAAGHQQIIIFIEDFKNYCQLVLEKFKDDGVPVLVIQGTLADENRRIEVERMHRPQAKGDDEDLL